MYSLGFSIQHSALLDGLYLRKRLETENYENIRPATLKTRKLQEKSSGKTPGKPRHVAAKSRRRSDIPADRGARERRSTTQGSE